MFEVVLWKTALAGIGEGRKPCVVPIGICELKSAWPA